MKFTITLADVERMKDALRASLANVKSSHRVEALARGLGWGSNAAMRAGLADAPVEAEPDETAFLRYLREHSFEAPADTLVHAFAKAGVQRAMDIEPALSSFGYRVFRERRETIEEAETRFRASRADMLTDSAIEEFIRAAEFLSRFGRRKTVNRKRNSYGLKHEAERWAGDYVSNGMLIAAALAMGFSAELTHPGSPNAYFDIRSKESAATGVRAEAA